MNKSTLYLLTVFALASAAPAAELNWILNGDFKATAPGNGWSGNLTTQPGRGGKPAAYFSNTQPSWSQNSQRVDLPQPAPPALEISGWIKIQDVVKGSKDWEMARITVVFFDAKGTRLGDWPAPIAQVQGTRDWEYYSNQYSVPKGCAWATVEISLGNCTGKAWFSELQCVVYDFDLKPLPRGGTTHPALKPASFSKSDNWLLDPGFETPGSGDWGQARIAGNGHDSLHCIVVSNEAPSWNLAAQDVLLNGKTPVAAVYGGWVRTEKVVRGSQEWEAARLGIDFRDASGKQLGGWQDSVCKVVGTTDWTYYEKKFTLPAGTAQVHVDAGLGNCVGKAWFDDLTLTFLDASGNKTGAELKSEQATNTSDWYPYQPPASAGLAALDLSSLNEKPAGNRGFVKIIDGHFAFADGTRVKFWGTDIVGPNIFLPHEEADLVARRMAKLGINLVRLHFLDNDWGDKSLFDPKADNTRAFLPESLDKMDYLIAALKKNGIYLYPDFSVGRKFREGDKVPGYQDLEMGAKGVIHFSRRVIDLNKEYAEALLTHVNPYTKLALKDDPVYVASEIVNESSIFSGFGEQSFPKPFQEELQRMFTEWAGTHSIKLRAGGKITRFKFDWNTQKLLPMENPENEAPSLKFLLETLLKSNREMKAFLKKVSPHALLAGSNMGLPVLGAIRGDAELDFMDTHAYWDHPQIWNVSGGWSNVDKAPMNNNSQLLNPFQGSLLFSLSHAPVSDKPLIVTEWNDCVPNEYRLEGTVLMAAYGCLQDWDGLLQFDYGPSVIGAAKMSNFSINSRPDNEPLYSAGAVIFRQGLLKSSDIIAVEPVADADVLANGSKSNGLFEHPWLPYAVKVVKKFTGKVKVPDDGLGDLAKLHEPGKKTVRSQTGEQTLDYGKGVLKIDSPFVQGYTGAIGTGGIWRTGDMALVLAKRNPWASILAVSLDRKPLISSKRYLVAAVARAENSGQTYNATRTALKNSGATPVLMQGVLAGIAIKVSGTAYKVAPLDASGKAGVPLKAVVEKGALKFTISPKDRTAYYLVEAQPAGK